MMVATAAASDAPQTIASLSRDALRRQDGIVEFVGKKIRLLDLPRLVRAANMYD